VARLRLTRRDGTPLFLIYALASLVPVGVLGAVLVHGYQRAAAADGLRQGMSQAVVIKEMAIIPALREVDLAEGLSPAERQRLQSATELAVFNGSVLRLRVYRLDGGLAFADDGSTGEVPAGEGGAFRRAAAGRVEAAIVPDPAGGPDSAVHVLEPIIANASGRATGVLELYLPYRAIAESVRERTDRTVRLLAGCLAGLYAVLALIAWYTTRALRLQAKRREYEALHDPLTGLANRKLFRARAAGAVGRIRRGESGAIVLVDLDHFKQVNDTLGHHAGDELLRVVAQRLTDALRTDDTVARLGGDEFGLVLPGITDPAVARELLTGVHERLSEQFLLGETPIVPEGSFGVSLYPRHGDDVEILLQHADAAMYQAKRGRSGIAVYAPQDAPPAANRLVRQSELRQARERDELIQHYQPPVEMT
jgi:diguanylate cyclase